MTLAAGGKLTYSGFEGLLLNGSAGDDIVVGSAGRDRIAVGGGADLVDGGAGDDEIAPEAVGVVSSAPLVDGVSGGAGNDLLDLSGLRFTTTVLDFSGLSGPGFTVVQHQGGTVYAAGFERVRLDFTQGPMANPIDVVGSSGDDEVKGGALGDTLRGGAGDDVLAGAAGFDTLDGGDGLDIAAWAAPAGDTAGAASSAYMDLEATRDWYFNGSDWDAIRSVEGARGERRNDNLLGDAGANRLEGMAGNDYIVGRGGDDLLDGGAGDDLLVGDLFVAGPGGRDVIRGGDGRDVVHAGEGADEVSGGYGDDLVLGGAGRDTLDGGAGNDILFAGATYGLDALAEGDIIRGGDGDDVVWGGAGNDFIDPGLGRDTVIAGAGDDMVWVRHDRTEVTHYLTVYLGDGRDRVVLTHGQPEYEADFGAGVSYSSPFTWSGYRNVGVQDFQAGDKFEARFADVTRIWRNGADTSFQIGGSYDVFVRGYWVTAADFTG